MARMPIGANSSGLRYGRSRKRTADPVDSEGHMLGKKVIEPISWEAHW